jgi:hypothetical protein
MNRILIRGGYCAAPIVVFGAVALISGGGRHRVLILALGVLLGVVLAVATRDDTADAAVPAAPLALSVPSTEADPSPDQAEASPLVATVPQQAGARDTP